VRNAYKSLIGEFERGRPLGILKCRCYDGSYRSEAGDRGLDLSGSGLSPLVGCCEYCSDRLGSIDDGESLKSTITKKDSSTRI
jgi:hypothetical protein